MGEGTVADFNCATFVFDEMDCAPRCEGTPDAVGVRAILIVPLYMENP